MKILIRFTFVTLILASCFLLPASNSSAQESSPKADFSVGILPPIIEISADTPANVESTISLQNVGENTQKLNIVFKSFRPAQSSNGQIQYIADGIEGPDPLIIQKVKIYDGDNEVNQIELGPYDSKDLKLKISLEKGAPAGDYYFSVLFLSEGKTATDTSLSSVPGGIGTNIILSVGKKGKVKGEILDFSTPTLMSKGPVPFTLLVRNDSPQFIVPSGRITIKDIFGKNVGTVDILPQYILSESQRYMVDSDQASPSAELAAILSASSSKQRLIWPETFLFGIYTATAHVKLSDSGPVFEKTIVFYALPVYAVFAISFIVFVLLGIYVKVRRKL